MLRTLLGGINDSRAAALHPLSGTIASVQRARVLVFPLLERVQQWSADYEVAMELVEEIGAKTVAAWTGRSGVRSTTSQL